MQEVTNLAGLIQRAAAHDGGARPALRWHDRVLTWAELDTQVDAVAAGLREAVGPAGREATGNDRPRVAIAMPNVPEFAAAYFGTLRAGLIAVPVNPGFTPRELHHIMSDSAAQVLIGTAGAIEAAGAGALPTLERTYHFGAAGTGPAFAELLRGPAGAAGGGTAAASEAVPEAAPSGEAGAAGAAGEDLAVLLYTSGTSGVPKGAMLSHRALLANHRQLAALDPAPIGPDDVVLLTLPLFHSYGLNAGLGAVAYHAACGVLVERFDPADTLAQMTRHRVSVVIGVPPMYLAWSLMDKAAADGFARVRTSVCGAAPLDPGTARRFADVTACPIHQGYGLTETAPVLTSTLGTPAPKPGSIGRPLPMVEIKLIDAAGEEVALVGGDEEEDELDYAALESEGTDPGEIVARGPNLFSGYWPDGRDGPDAEGWWPTGDVAYADGEDDLFLVDRLGELIIVNGFNVYPHEVELVLAAHSDVVEAAAVGVPNPYSGQAVKAFVVLRPDAEVTAETLIAYCERNLARFKCPTAVEFLPELPKSPTGKVRKTLLLERA